MPYSTIKMCHKIFGLEVIASGFQELSPSEREQIFSFRKKVFVDRNNWKIESYKGGVIECDEYDDDDAKYIYIASSDCILGCVRLRPSTSPTLLTGPFKWLKESSKSWQVQTEDTWEASRFFITQHSKKCYEQGGIDRRTYALFISMIQFGVISGFAYYEVVVDEKMARILRRSGWTLEVLNKGVGNKNEIIYYGLLPCDSKIFEHIMYAMG
ncbi:hypothetical protein J7J49_04210 [Halomonas sp. ISL-56]|uniref:acyl-homoserine-lactone synthase n=1 Tax=Halomonas sp. ISL-56 TaxID=2819149 RepID=UPI001BE89DCC|nr:acyl-homoserine-lactone synthase [Halomonas sp. ISL-56]MBT2800524.1 hypothetical protein [Halomonas sp. ISL-56]